MSHSNFTSPIMSQPMNSGHGHGHNLCGLLEHKLTQHNNNSNTNQTQAVLLLNRKRRTSLTDKISTPYNSPAINNLTNYSMESKQNLCESLTLHNKRSYNNKGLSPLSPLHLSALNTPPTTPDQNYQNYLSRRSNKPLNARVVINGQSMVFNNFNGMPHGQRLRSLSCSETMLVKKTKIMSPQLIPCAPVLTPVSAAAVRKIPELKIPNPISPQCFRKHSSSITPRGQEDEGLVFKFEELQTFGDIQMDE